MNGGYPIVFQTADKCKAATDMDRLRLRHKRAYVLRGMDGLIYSCPACRKSGSYKKMMKEFCRRR